MFIDRIKVFAQAGSGGRGSGSCGREKFVPKGGPDGGGGGRGGDVILMADRHVDNLSNLFYEPIIKAKNGGHGMGKKMAGRSGADKIVKVPVGTIVWEAEAGKRSTPKAFASRQLNSEGFREQAAQPASARDGLRRGERSTSNQGPEEIEDQKSKIENEPLVDLVRDGQEFVLCRGGAGGKGNVHFKSSRNRAPLQ